LVHPHTQGLPSTLPLCSVPIHLCSHLTQWPSTLAGPENHLGNYLNAWMLRPYTLQILVP
jgi:hypothetical protein